MGWIYIQTESELNLSFPPVPQFLALALPVWLRMLPHPSMSYACGVWNPLVTKSERMLLICYEDYMKFRHRPS